MKLIRIKLENFKGIRNEEFYFFGQNANIYGANGTGKTTINDAFTWLMFGKSSGERSGFSPKTITPEGYAHNIEHAVECDIEINGVTATFRRVYHEVYKKTRGHADAVLSGHTTDYWIDGVPQKEKDYQKYWQDFFGSDEVVKLLTMPYYFSEGLNKDDRRKLAVDICGGVSDIDIMNSDEELKALADVIGGNTIDDYKKIVKSQRSEINRRIDAIPARIDEAEKAIPDISGISESEIDSRLEELRQIIAENEKVRADLLLGNDGTSKARAKIADINLKLSEAKRAHSEREQAAEAEVYGKIQILRSNLARYENTLAEINRDFEYKRQKVAEIEKKREEIKTAHIQKQEEHIKIQGETFDESLTVCDKCGQALPPDRITELREDFNERKSNRLAELTAEMNKLIEFGKKNASKEMLAAAQQEVTDFAALVEENEKNVSAAKAKLDEAQNMVHQLHLTPFELTEEYAEISEELSAARKLEASSLPDTSEIDADIESFREEVKALEEKKSAFAVERTQRKRIAELEAEEKELGKRYDEAEHALYLCEKFTRVKTSLLSDRINERFKTVRFRMFTENVTNDGIVDCCDVLVPSESGAFVPFADANRAARLNAGIEIIGVLGEYYGIELPIFVDNAESVTEIVPTKGQLIRLVVSENDKKLRLELA